MMTVTRLGRDRPGVADVAKKDAGAEPRLDSPRMPRTPTVRLDDEDFAVVWWTCQIEADPTGRPKAAADLLHELLRAGLAARKARHAAEIQRRRKLHFEEAGRRPEPAGNQD